MITNRIGLHSVLLPLPMNPKLKLLELLWNQTVNLHENRLQNSVLYSILKLRYSPSILRHNMHGTLNNSHSNCHRNYTNRISLQKHMDQMINLCILWDACHELFCVFKDFYVSGTQDAEETQSLSQLTLWILMSHHHQFSQNNSIHIKIKGFENEIRYAQGKILWSVNKFFWLILIISQ